MSIEYYDPTDVNAEELIKRVRIGRSTEELIRTPTGSSLVSRATQDYREGIEALDKNGDAGVGRFFRRRTSTIP